MATVNYTTLLGLALPTTGDLSGQWGNEVNEYISKYVDASVAGTQTISGSQTAVTLSPTNGSALSQAGSGSTGSSQYAVINCTGNPASTLTITVTYSSLTNAQFSKTYAVINATSTSQSVVVRATTSSGTSSGVTVASGERCLITWNGSNFVKVSSTVALPAGSTTQVQYNNAGALAGSANLTFDGTNFTTTRTQVTTAGTPPASGAGVEVVGGTSPVILTYNRGTSAYLPMTQYGSAFTWGLNGGTTDLVLTSTGLGIGTSSPAAKLDVNSSGAVVMRLTRNGGTATNTGLQYYNGTNSWYAGMSAGGLYAIGYNDANLDVGQIRLDSSGNLGLGVTPSAWFTTNGTRAFQVGARGSFFSFNGTTSDVGNNIYQSASTDYAYVATAAASLYRQSAGAHIWYNAASGTAGNTITLTQELQITAAGFTQPTAYADTVSALGNTGTATTINLQNANVFTATLTGNCTFTLSNAIATGSSSFTLILTNDGTAGRTVAWAGGSFVFPGGAASLSRTTTANAVDVWVFFTPNGGTTWYGNIAMKDMKA